MAGRLVVIAFLLFSLVPSTGVSAPGKSSPVDLNLSDLERKKVHLRDYRGKIVVLDFWATWCGPCKDEMPMLVASEKAWAAKGVISSLSATSGGMHTGGEMVILDALRSLMGSGAEVFTLGQKLMVFTTDERTGVPDGSFTLLDCWYMDLFARRIAVVAMSHLSRERAAALAAKLDSTPYYYRAMPSAEDLKRYEPAREETQRRRGGVQRDPSED